MSLFSKEKDIVLKIVNSFLVIGAVVAIIIAIATGIKIINKEEILSYDEYSEKLVSATEKTIEGSSSPRGRIYDRNLERSHRIRGAL
jgi:cell division protein FtsI/penicillin-binding protein 2